MINFKDITESTSYYNFHTHTQFCDGHAPMEEFVTEAIAMGFRHLGFTPHGPISIESPCNMTRDNVSAYLSEINRLQEAYGSVIAIYAGMEVDYIRGVEQNDPFMMQLPLDYRIGSVHFIPSFDDPKEYVDIDGRFERFKVKMSTYFHGDIEAVIRSYFSQYMDMLDKGGFDVAGHFDKIGLNASLYSEGIDDCEWYDQLVERAFESIMDHGYAVEVNTKSWHNYNRFFPHLKYFDMLKKYHATILVNSDAHYPSLINSGREEALQLLT